MDKKCIQCRLCTHIGYVKKVSGSSSSLFVCGKGESEYYGLVFLYYHEACGFFEPKQVNP